MKTDNSIPLFSTFRYLIWHISLVLLLFIPGLLLGQYEEDEIPYTQETGVGINLNTNGGILGGIMFKHSRHIQNGVYHYFGLELVNVKHPKEQRVSSPVSGNSFIFYKQNYLFVIRPQYGREFLLFRKSEEEGVRVSGLIALGPSIGLVKPYAIEYDYTDYSSGYTGPPKDVRNEAYDPLTHLDEGRILGTGGIFTAANQTKVVPGLNFKTGLLFEFGNSNTGLEVGTLLEIYPKPIILIPFSKNNSIFTSIYINIFLGIRD